MRAFERALRQSRHHSSRDGGEGVVLIERISDVGTNPRGGRTRRRPYDEDRRDHPQAWVELAAPERVNDSRNRPALVGVQPL